MNYFESVTTAVDTCGDGGCTVTFHWTFIPDASFEWIQITHNASGRSEVFPANPSRATIFAWYAEYNVYTVTARTGSLSELDDHTRLPGPNGCTAYFEDARLNFTVPVNLPAPPDQFGAKNLTPGKPKIIDVVVEDGSLLISWRRPSGSVDIDGYTIAVVEQGRHLQPMQVKPSQKSVRFSPTRPTHYDIGVAAYNNVFAPFGDGHKLSEFDWRRVVVPSDKSWPPSGIWQSWSFPQTNRVANGARDAMTAVSREPSVMDVFWIEPVIPRLKMGRVKTAFYRDGIGWGYADLPFPIQAHTQGPIATVSRRKGLVEIFWATHLGSLQHAWWYPDSGWSSGLLIPTINSVQPATPIAAISRSENHIEIFWITPSGAVRHGWWYEGGQWNFGEVAPAGSASSLGGISACSRRRDTMEVFWITPAGSIDNAWWYEHDAAKGWSRGHVAAEGAASPISRVAVVSRKPETMELFYVSPKAELKNAYFYEGGAWNGDVLHASGVSAMGGLSAVSRHPETMEVFWTSSLFMSSLGLHNTYWYDGKWRTDARPPGHASSPLSPIAAVSRNPGTMEVWSAGQVGNVWDHYIYFKS